MLGETRVFKPEKSKAALIGGNDADSISTAAGIGGGGGEEASGGGVVPETDAQGRKLVDRRVKKYDKTNHVPRFFVMHHDGSATEVRGTATCNSTRPQTARFRDCEVRSNQKNFVQQISTGFPI